MALDFLFLYEHVAREYESITLLKLELERRGYTCDIRQLLDRKKLKYFTWKKPKVLVASNLYNNEGLNSHVYNNVGKLNKVVNLHWEQMLSDTQEEGAWFNFEGNAKKCIQTCWGEKTKARLVKHGMPKENAVVTGAVMMDFLRAEFSGYYKTKEELCAAHNLDENLPLMLYISSFGYAAMPKEEVDELSRMAGEDFSDFARVNRESMAKTLEYFSKYLQNNPNVQLVWRPHPSEWNSDELCEMQKKYKNFKVINSGNVKQWVLAADVITIWMSSAIAEVYFANKNCIILRPAAIPHQFDPVIYKNANFISNYISFEKEVNNCIKNTSLISENNKFPIEREILEGYFENNTTPAYVKMANLLQEVYNNPPQSTPFNQDFKPHFNLIKAFALFGVHILFALRLNPKRFSKFAGRIYGYIEKAHITKKEIKQIEDKIRPYILLRH